MEFIRGSEKAGIFHWITINNSLKCNFILDSTTLSQAIQSPNFGALILLGHIPCHFTAWGIDIKLINSDFDWSENLGCEIFFVTRFTPLWLFWTSILFPFNLKVEFSFKSQNGRNQHISRWQKLHWRVMSLTFLPLSYCFYFDDLLFVSVFMNHPWLHK